MSAGNILATDEKAFFTMVKDATLANPFSDERIDIDLKITGLPVGVDRKERVQTLAETIRKKIGRFEKKGLNINLFSGEDRNLIEIALLFDFFHQFVDRFDQLIPAQIEAGDASLKVPFAREALYALKNKGFDAGQATHYFALCYQIRRAFYFIDHSLVGRSPGMKALRRNLWNNVFTHNIGLYDNYLWNRMEDFSTLILGETGTGKGSSAMSIGRSGFIPFDEKKMSFEESFTRSFVSINLSQFPETLIESELFGHKKGAFTGAVENYKGLFDQCSPYGSIFLDEIGEVQIPVQIKLLQVIQERIYSPVGSHQKNRFRGRVIAATNRAIHEIREKKILRDDFFYRLCSDIIVVPPLRQRIEEDSGELDDLLALTIQRILGKPSPELVSMIRKKIEKKPGRNYPWPGNVRELEQCVRRILLKKSYDGDHRPVARDLATVITDGVLTGDMDAQSLLSAYCCLLYRNHGTFEAVAARTKLDRRTVKKYIMEWEERNQTG